MTVAYPLTRQADYSELRYSLRSIEKYLQPSEVVIIGESIPNWLTNVTKIWLGDIPGRRQISVRRKIYAALEYSDEILFMNDDIYFLQPAPIHYYWFGDLKSNQHSGSKQLQNELKAMGKPTLNFEMHMPIIFKQDFKSIMENFSSDTLIRSAYCNYSGIEGVNMIDCKIVAKPKTGEAEKFIMGRQFLSTGPNSFKTLEPILAKMFNNKSIFEA